MAWARPIQARRARPGPSSSKKGCALLAPAARWTFVVADVDFACDDRLWAALPCADRVGLVLVDMRTP
ncbi:MAG TPA: hypothetical protein DD664_05395 [Janibacter terrae]|nr:hypothetical protein [Janibacter terrae]